MGKEKNCYSHFILYAKNWYKKTDTIKDLIRIQSVYSSVDEKHLCIGDVYRMMLEITQPFILKNPSSCLLRFFATIIPKNTWQVGYHHRTDGSKPLECLSKFENEYDFMTAVIYNCLSVLRNTTMSDIEGLYGKIEKRDSSILPITLKPRQKKIINN